MRYFIYFSYDGTQYHGWQIQPNALSIQEKINESLQILLREKILTIGAGRTDTGVNALEMVAHFDTVHELPLNFINKMNSILPQDIAIKKIQPVQPNAHARFDAISRTYHYTIYQHKNPFYRHFATYIHYPLDFQKMNIAAEILLNIKDFTSFSKLHSDAKNNICNITEAYWTEIDSDLWQFRITANRFLRNMVRAIVGTLIQVGRNKISIENFHQIIDKKDRCAAADSAPGKALSLVEITYPMHLFL